jgi:alpha,alpha-trehalase
MGSVGALVSAEQLSAARPSQTVVGPSAPDNDRTAWMKLDDDIKLSWDSYISSATEKEIRQDASGTLIFLPFPYVSPTAPGSVYRFMFGWDTDFVSRALIAQGKPGQARRHLLNYCFMIDRFGYMPNANTSELTTRSQTPLVADTTWRYFEATRDRDFLLESYPRLKRNYLEYWNAAHHQTPTGLATNRDLGDGSLAPRLAAEAETGLDWTPIYNGDVRRCVPLITNCALVRYADRLSKIAAEIGRGHDARTFSADAGKRAALIRKYCWSDQEGFFLEYDFVAARQLPCLSDCALWTLWAGIATRQQAKRLVSQLGRIEQSHGLSSTDRAYPTPSPAAEYEPTGRMAPNGTDATDPATGVGGNGPLQWMYPAGWAPSHVIAVEGLDTYGYRDDAERIARKFLNLVSTQYTATGHLWEKYNVVEGSVVLPNARYGNVWMQGWTAAAVALLGRRVFFRQPLASIQAKTSATLMGR